MPKFLEVSNTAGAKAAIAADAMFDPRDYGAVGNGIADDTDALNSALTAAADGGLVAIPTDHRFAYTGTLTIPDGVSIAGCGRGASSTAGAGGALVATAADAVIQVGSHCHLKDLRIEGGGTVAGVANWGLHVPYVKVKPQFTNVLVSGFVQSAFIFESTQNVVLVNCTVKNTPLGYVFYNGAAVIDMYGCSYDNYGVTGAGVGGTAARAIVVENSADARLDGTVISPGNREINIWGGIFERGSGEHVAEIIDGPSSGDIRFHSAQLCGSSGSVSIIDVGSGYSGNVILSDCLFAFNDTGSTQLVTAAAGHIRYRGVRFSGAQGRNIVSKTTLTGSAVATYSEPDRLLINSRFQTGLYAHETASWTSLGAGTVAHNATKKRMDLSCTTAATGGQALWSGYVYYAQQYNNVTLRFKLSNCTGPIRVNMALSGSPFRRNVGAFGNGSHEIVCELDGTEQGIALTSENGTAVTAEVDYFVVEHGGHGGNGPSQTIRSAATSYPGATPTMNTDLYDQYVFTLINTAITSMSTNLSGTPVNGQRLSIRFTDNGANRAITWGASFTGTLLATTSAGNTHIQELVYDSTAAKWVGTYSDTTGY